LGAARESELDNRYLTEDVGYTMVLFTELGRAVGVPTPTMDAVIEIASVLLGRDFRREAPRTLASLGLGDLDAAGLAKL
jgi:opine dehydrogenase